MSDTKKIAEQDLTKALSTLADLAKGHNSRGTATTTVDSMSGESGATQVFHTSSNSDPGDWAGSKATAVAENGASDMVDENGTDMRASKMVKSILDKLNKGQPITAEEFALVKGALPAFLKKDKAGTSPGTSAGTSPKGAGDDDEEDDKKVAKSLADEASDNDTVAQGMEISDFLSEFVGVISKSLTRMENRILKQVAATIEQEAARSEAFGKSLAGALSALGEGLVANTQRVEQFESTPARGPKSQTVLEKSLGEGGEQLSKSMIAATLVDMVEHNKISAQEVLKFDSTGGISDTTMQKVLAYRAGK